MKTRWLKGQLTFLLHSGRCWIISLNYLSRQYMHRLCWKHLASKHLNYYRPQRSCGQRNVFTGVCLSTGGEGVCLSACWDTRPPQDQADTPPDQADPPGPGRPHWTRQTPPGPGRPPRTRQTPWDQADTPQTRQTPRDQADPPWEADCSIRSTSGRYASYWNAFLYYS